MKQAYFSRPCNEWAEKLVLKPEDLSPEDNEALQKHVRGCDACLAAQSDYETLLVRLRELPSPTLKPLPRFSPFLFESDKEQKDAQSATDAMPTDRRQQGAPHRRINKGRFAPPQRSRGMLARTINGFMTTTTVACLILLAIVLFRPWSHTSSINIQPPITTTIIYQGHKGWVMSLAWSPDGTRIASMGDDSTIQIWNATTGKLLYTYSGNWTWGAALAWSPDSSRIASTAGNNTVQIWNATTGEVYATYQGHNATVSALAWSNDGKQIASGSYDHTVQIWDVATGVTYQTLKLDRRIMALAWSPNDQRLALSEDNNTVQIWDTTTERYQFSYKLHKGAVSALAWSPDGTRIASASYDSTVQVWNATTGARYLTYKGHSAVVTDIAWSHDGTRIASASYDSTVQVWNASTGRPEANYSGQNSWVFALAWSPDDKHIVSCGKNDVRVWNVP
jgi:WD40 repeat protein